jgi:BirA family biotin operon repressor/biotin-[acetyl-CoA-carboxylase] ligase
MVGERKAGGILMEGRVTGDRLDHAVVGIGLNLAGSPPDVDGATGLGDADGPTILEGFLRRFREAYAPTAPSFPDAVVDSYRPLCSTLGRRVRATTRGGEATEGLAADIDTSGGLLLETAKGRRLVRFGEIEHLRG